MSENIFESNPRKTIIVIALIVILLIDVSVANLYKLYSGHSFNNIDHAKMVEMSYRIKSDIYHHDLKKNVSISTAHWGGMKYVIATDSLGFKAQKRKNTPVESNNYRIVFIGDSFTEGMGYEYQDTFVGQVASSLSKDNIEVLNAAVASYSPSIYYRKIKYLIEDVGLQFNELIVYIDISDILDEAIHYEMSPSNTVVSIYNNSDQDQPRGLATVAKTFITDNSIFIYSLLNEIHDYFSANKQVKSWPIVNLKRSMWTVDNEIYNDYGITGLQKATHYMGLLHELLEDNNVKLTISVYPWPDQIVNNDLESVQVTHWRTWAQNKNIDFINYFPCFIQDDCDEDCRQKVLDNLFIEGDVHWNKSGHKLISDGYLSFYVNHLNHESEQNTPPDNNSTDLTCSM